MPNRTTERAARCHATLTDYCDAWDARTNLIDLLTDVRHWCDFHRESFAALDRTAYRHYIAELADERRRP
jgi:hypothetical protein